jgi:hypothetical protein
MRSTRKGITNNLEGTVRLARTTREGMPQTGYSLVKGRDLGGNLESGGDPIWDWGYALGDHTVCVDDKSL